MVMATAMVIQRRLRRCLYQCFMVAGVIGGIGDTEAMADSGISATTGTIKLTGIASIEVAAPLEKPCYIDLVA